MPNSLLIFIEIIEKVDFRSPPGGDSFHNPLLERIKRHYPDITFYEMDNLSEGIVIDYAIRALQMAENVCIIFFIKEQAKLHKLRKFQESLINSNKKLSILVLGEHPTLERMLKPLENKWVKQAASSEDWLEPTWNWFEELVAGL